ncbi:MAG: SH3 domain-containing protein [Clostridia bacterium]|nr:SH3 domain-containing protein [Clostridia bacterium]
MSRPHSLLKPAVSILLLLALVFSSLFSALLVAEEETLEYDPLDHGIRNGGDVTDNVYVAKRIDQILKEFPVGSYFSKTGKPCTCHGKCNWYDGCECISVYDDPENGKEIWLYSIQCMGFSHLCFYKIFGFMGTTAYPENADKFESLGSLSTSKMTVENVKNLFSKAKTGADIRVNGHSMVFLKQDADFIWILQANWDDPCKIDMRKWSWEDFTARYKNKGVEYVYMPKVYPTSEGEYVPPVPDTDQDVTSGHPLGNYKVTATNSGLRLREGPGTSYAQLALLPDGTVVSVTEVSGDWGKVTYSGKTGWISLTYTDFVGDNPILRVTLPLDRAFVYPGVTADFSGITVVKHNSDKTTETLKPADFTVTYAAESTGACTATVTAGELTATFPITVIPCGDVDANGIVNVSDAMLIQRGELSLRQTEGADVDGNGAVNVEDAKTILKYLTGGVSSLPLPKEG